MHLFHDALVPFAERRIINMKKVVEFLQANPVQYLATVGRDGKAKCRPFMLMPSFYVLLRKRWKTLVLYQ